MTTELLDRVLHRIPEALLAQILDGPDKQLLVVVAQGNKPEGLLWGVAIVLGQHLHHGLHRSRAGVQPDLGQRTGRALSRHLHSATSERELVQHTLDGVVVHQKQHLRPLRHPHPRRAYPSVRLRKICHAAKHGTGTSLTIDYRSTTAESLKQFLSSYIPGGGSGVG